jgi:hypothetical protein
MTGMTWTDTDRAGSTRRRGNGSRSRDVITVALFFSAVLLVASLTFLYIDGQERALARNLATSGVTTTANNGQIRPDCTGKGCITGDKVRVTVALPDGPRVLELRGAYPDTSGLPVETWTNALAGNQYHGQLSVTYDPDDPKRVMEAADMSYAQNSGDVTIDVILVSTFTVFALAFTALRIAGPLRQAAKSRHGVRPDTRA